MKYFFFVIYFLFIQTAFAFNSENSNNFLVISDIHLNTKTTHTMEINPSSFNSDNDLDKTTFIQLLKGIAEDPNLPKPKFILVLGDIVGHERPTETSVFDSESEVFEKLKSHFSSIPIFYIFGNNDSFEVNYGPFKTKTQKSPALVATLSGWQDGFLSTGGMCEKNAGFPCVITENTDNGYYSAYLEPKLRLIALNTVMFSPKRVLVTEDDAQIQLKWLEAELKQATANQESVMLAMHIPPGNNIFDHSPFLVAKDNSDFLNLIRTYQTTIIGLLVGHTHMEELKIIKDSNNKIINDVLFTAGLSTSHGNAPSVKTFYYDKSDTGWQINNYQTYHFTDPKTLLPLYDYHQYYACLNNENIMQCLPKVTLDNLKRYYTAGNPNFRGVIQSPDDIYIQG